MENNKLIAEFMELKEGKKYLSPSLEDPEAIGLGMYVSVDEMRYHKSWDWLMPVIRHIIDELNYELPEDSNLIGDIMYGLVDINIKETYQGVIKFIKWYTNLNK